LMEKPLANSVEKLEPLKDYTESVRIMPGHLELFNPVSEQLRANLGQIGTPIYVSSRRIGLYPRRQWGIGVMQDLGYHEIYMQRSLFGNPEKVDSLMRCFKNENEDSALVLLKFKDGVHGLIEANWLTPTKFRQLTVYGSTGTLTVDYITQGAKVIEAGKDGTMRLEKTSRPYSTKEPLMRELDAFLNSKTLPVTLQDGIDTLSLTLKAIQSQI
ncbi:MAG: Gfo/Idh/MocA family protein, partial [Candidatus Ranarchaeia archaeon]